MQQFDHCFGRVAMENLNFRVPTPIHRADTGKVQEAASRGIPVWPDGLGLTAAGT